jgi:hypothetical protein
MRLKQTTAPDPLMQFGMIEASEVRTDSDELDKGSKRRKKHKIEHQTEDDDDDARKKARGRPRVDTKDETAADVSSVYFLIYSISSIVSSRPSTFEIFDLKKSKKKHFYIRHVKSAQ